MATVAELERLEALSSRLIPLASAERGELIRAQDWNIVVGALIEVAQAVLAEEREDVPPPHEHPDQVGVGWLDPRLRSLVERGPLADPAGVARVTNLERGLARLSGRLEETAGNIEQVRDRVTEVATRDLEREAQITTIRRVIEGVSDARDDILDLRETLRSIQENVSIAVDVGSRLVVDGEPVDIEAWDARIKDLEALQERLRMPTGELLDAAALEIRLTELTNTLVTEHELDEALKSRPGVIPPEQVEGLEEKLRATLMAEVETSLGRVSKEIEAKTGERLAAVDTLVARAVSDALPGLTQSVLSSVQPKISSAVNAGMEKSRAFVEERLGATEAALREDLGQKILDVQRGVNAAVQTEFKRQLPAHLKPIQTDVAELGQRTRRVESKLIEHDELLRNIGTRVEVVAQDAAVARADLERTTIDEMDHRVDAIRSALEAQLSETDAAIRERVSADIADAKLSIMKELDRVASEVASTEVSIVANRLRGEMRAVASDEIAALQGKLQSTVTAQVEREVRRVLKNQPDLITRPLVDFTVINGIGPTLDERLRTANVRTFDDLAALGPDEVAEILGTSAARVASLDIIGQARRLSR